MSLEHTITQLSKALDGICANVIIIFDDQYCLLAAAP
jgi:two-component SAPR family response regulator